MPEARRMRVEGETPASVYEYSTTLCGGVCQSIPLADKERERAGD